MQPPKNDLPKQAVEQNELIVALADIPGGRDLVEWFDSEPHFGDAEVVSLYLDRKGPSLLRIAVEHRGKYATVVFELTHWIDANLYGFSHQNVIGGLQLRRAEDRDVQPWELGVGCQPGEWLVELEPCFGAYGTIRANVARISFEKTETSECEILDS